MLHPTRYSMMLWIMDSESRKEVEEAEGYLDDDWTPSMILGHEFSLLPCLFPQNYPDHKKIHALGEDEDEALMLTQNCHSIQEMQVLFIG